MSTDVDINKLIVAYTNEIQRLRLENEKLRDIREQTHTLIRVYDLMQHKNYKAAHKYLATVLEPLE